MGIRAGVVLADAAFSTAAIMLAAHAAQHLTRPKPRIDELIALRLVVLVTRRRGLAANATTLLIGRRIDGIMSACGSGVLVQFFGAG